MKVTFLSTNDRTGGAAIVTFRLMEALVARGIDARMVVARKVSESPRVSTVSPIRYKVSFIAERAEIFARSRFKKDNIWKVDTAWLGCGAYKHPWVREADVVVLSWVNQGLVSLADVEKIHHMGKPILWIMHDIWCATGICHHSGECRRYEMECGACKFLNSTSCVDLSTYVQQRKKTLYSRVPITFVAVSRWLAQICKSSSLMCNARIEVLPNAFPVESYSVSPTQTRGQLGLPADGPIIVFAAARLDDPIKNFPLAIAALNHLYSEHPQLKPKAVFCGNIKDVSLLQQIAIPYVHLGQVTSAETMAQIFAHATVVLSTSVCETLPGTLIEGMAAGATPVATSHGGQADIVETGVDGYLAFDDSPQSVSNLLFKALSAPFDRKLQHDAVARRFDSRAIADRFIDLIS